MDNLEIIPVEQLSAIIGGKDGDPPAPSGGKGGFLDNLKIDIAGNINTALDQIGTAGQRLIGCGFGANSRQEFGRCVLTGQLDPQQPQQPQQQQPAPGR